MTITWGSTTTHPNPSVFTEKDEMVGGSGVMADGSFVMDVIATKKRITLQWSGITAAQATALYAQAVTRTSAAMDLTNVGGSSYVGGVIPMPGSASKSPSGGDLTTLGFDVSVEVRTA